MFRSFRKIYYRIPIPRYVLQPKYRVLSTEISFETNKPLLELATTTKHYKDDLLFDTMLPVKTPPYSLFHDNIDMHTRRPDEYNYDMYD